MSRERPFRTFLIVGRPPATLLRHDCFSVPSFCLSLSLSLIITGDIEKLHLATCTDNQPHVALMNYTYLPSSPYSSAPVIVMTTNPASKKTNNLVANPNVSLLVHDCTLSPSPPFFLLHSPCLPKLLSLPPIPTLPDIRPSYKRNHDIAHHTHIRNCIISTNNLIIDKTHRGIPPAPDARPPTIRRLPRPRAPLKPSHITCEPEHERGVEH